MAYVAWAATEETPAVEGAVRADFILAIVPLRPSSRDGQSGQDLRLHGLPRLPGLPDPSSMIVLSGDRRILSAEPAETLIKRWIDMMVAAIPQPPPSFHFERPG